MVPVRPQHLEPESDSEDECAEVVPVVKLSGKHVPAKRVPGASQSQPDVDSRRGEPNGIIEPTFISPDQPVNLEPSARLEPGPAQPNPKPATSAPNKRKIRPLPPPRDLSSRKRSKVDRYQAHQVQVHPLRLGETHAQYSLGFRHPSSEGPKQVMSNFESPKLVSSSVSHAAVVPGISSQSGAWSLYMRPSLVPGGNSIVQQQSRPNYAEATRSRNFPFP